MSSTGPRDSSLITEVTCRAMATEFAVLLPAHHSDAVEPAVEALEQLDAIEASLTVYQPESEISRVNRDAFVRPVTLTPATFSLIQRAIQWSQRTDGAFDITAGPLVEAWGFTRRRGRKPSAAEVGAALDRVGYQHLVLDQDRRSVRFAQQGMSINLGGIGKGDALDRIAARLRRDGITDFLLHGGSSSVVACGDQEAGSELGWAVGIAHPTKPKRRLGGIWLRDRALATSGSGKQFFHHRGKRYGHVIDPRTGFPAGDLMALTVIMESAADADACSTGLFVAGQESIPKSAAWEIPAMIAMAAGTKQDEVEVESIGEVPWLTDQDGAIGGVSRDAS
jgi:thiamine biosynthesis lipoprotein